MKCTVCVTEDWVGMSTRRLPVPRLKLPLSPGEPSSPPFPWRCAFGKEYQWRHSLRRNNMLQERLRWETSPARQWHYIQSFAVILAQKFCKDDFCRSIPLTGSTLLSSALRQKNFFFQSAHLRDTSSQALLTIYHKKICHHHVHRPPATICHSTTNWAIGSRSFLPPPPPNFVFQLWRQNAPLQTAMDKMHTMGSLFWATNTEERKKKGSQNVHPAPKMRAKIQKHASMHSRCSPIASRKARVPSSSTSAAGFLIAGAHPALCFFPLPFTVVKETWQPVLPVYTSQKQAKKPTWCSEPWLSNMHAAWCLAAHASLHYLHVDLRKPQGWWLLLSSWGSQKRHRHCVTREKNSFPFVKKSHTSHWSESDENAKWLRDCVWLCQACKRGFTCRPM